MGCEKSGLLSFCVTELNLCLCRYIRSTCCFALVMKIMHVTTMMIIKMMQLDGDDNANGVDDNVMKLLMMRMVTMMMMMMILDMMVIMVWQ